MQYLHDCEVFVVDTKLIFIAINTNKIILQSGQILVIIKFTLLQFLLMKP